jgi:sulfur-oxidizing protein SoxX
MGGGYFVWGASTTSVVRMKRLVATAVCAATLAACAPNTALIVHFPLGNTQRGREAFVALECHACHRIAGIEVPPHPSPSFNVALGGHTPRIETYGDIISAIVNPSHRLARSYRVVEGRGEPSPMQAQFLNEIMTTQQLVDIAAFLQPEYEYVPPPPPPYWESYPNGEDKPFDYSGQHIDWGTGP